MGISNSANELELSLTGIADALEVGLSDAVAKISFDAMRGFVERTPIDTGAAAGNWAISEGAQADHHLEEGFRGDRASAADKAMGTFATVGFHPPFRTYWLANFLPYIEVLEFGRFGKPPGSASGDKTVRGFSRQAPAGMVRATLADIETELTGVMERAMRAKGL